MIRGALILAVGFGLGYAKALHEQDDIRENIVSVMEFLKEKQQADADKRPPDAESTATEEPEALNTEGE